MLPAPLPLLRGDLLQGVLGQYDAAAVLGQTGASVRLVPRAAAAAVLGAVHSMMPF